MKTAAMKTTAKKAAAKGGVLSKTGIATALAEATEQKPAVVKQVLDSLVQVATSQVKKNGKSDIRGTCKDGGDRCACVGHEAIREACAGHVHQARRQAGLPQLQQRPVH